jgi:hypothetical protein
MHLTRKTLMHAGLAATMTTLILTMAVAAPDDPPRHAPDGAQRRGPDGGPRGQHDGPRRPDGGLAARPDGTHAPRPDGAHGPRTVRDRDRWYDGAHGHARYYPAPGWAVRTLPPRHRVVVWAGVNYGFYDGIWYAPGPHGYAVVRPPYGVVVAELPGFRTLVTIGGIGYLYANGVYYRERVEGGYEVVPPPVASEGAGNVAPLRTYVYPRLGQSAEQQATDEYECHRWAVTQTGFDPTAVVVTSTMPVADPTRRDDYQRARTACLEGRNYTVR